MNSLLNHSFFDVTVFDLNSERLQISKQHFNPNCKIISDENDLSNDFDHILEISGNLKGLSLAQEKIGKGGKIVIGSWYGDNTENNNINLGFGNNHRLIVPHWSLTAYTIIFFILKLK